MNRLPLFYTHAGHNQFSSKQLRFVPDESVHEYRDVNPLAWGQRFHGPGTPGHTWVSKEAMKLIAEHGGRS